MRPLNENLTEINKKHSIESILRAEGITVKGNMFKAVWRGEKTASCSIYANGKKWKDQGEGTKGDLIDLYRKLKGCDFKTAISELLNTVIAPGVKSAPEKTKALRNTITNIKDIENKSLIHYSQTRGISKFILNRYCKEVHYKNDKGNFYAIGFKNDKGGYEIRTKIFKACVGNKDISTLNSGHSDVAVFEGFFDFLSAVVIFGTKLSDKTCIVLNSTANINKLNVSGFKKVFSFMDNDNTGRKATDKLRNKAMAADAMFKDMTYCMGSSKDLNERLIKGG